MPQETLCFSGEQYDVVGWFVDFFYCFVRTN